MSNQALIEVPDDGDRTLAEFYDRASAELHDLHFEILTWLSRAVTDRGWLESVERVTERLADSGLGTAAEVGAAIAELQHRRLLSIDQSGAKFTGLLGAISLAPTKHRAHLDNGIDIHTFGGMDLLTLHAMLHKPLDLHTVCPVSGRAVTMRVADSRVVTASPAGVAGFWSFWDGSRPLAEVAAHSPLFADDEALAAWEKAHPSLKGLALPADLLLWVGLEAAAELGALRFKLIGYSG